MGVRAASPAEENVLSDTMVSVENGTGTKESDRNNCITDLEIEGKNALVTYQVDRKADIVVAIYDESTGRMLGSGTKTVREDAHTVELEITSEGGMPEYFIAAAYLLDAGEHVPLCDKLETKRYAKETGEGKIIDKGSCGEHLTYKITVNGKNEYDEETYTLTIEGYGDMKEYVGIIPWEKYKKSLTELVLLSDITSIRKFRV